MAFSLAEYFQKQGLRVVEQSVQGLVGKPLSSVREEALYRQQAIQPGWIALPVPVRLLMKRDFERWDQLYFTLRDEVFDLTGQQAALHADASERIARIVEQFYGAAARSAPGGGLPLAKPVAFATSGAAVPIARPVASTPEHADASPVVGIDLGTTYSVVAYIDAHGRPCSCINGDGERLTPSVILLDEGGPVVGKQAVMGSILEPDKAADCVKRDMGGKFYRRKVNEEYMPPEVLSSLILRSLKADAERQLGPIRKAVITVPAYFDETRRRATMDAGRLAGLEVLDIINEPTAAAIAYGYQEGYLDPAGQLVGDKPLRVLVFDLGGGTFDVTIVEIQKNAFKALATDGDVHLGGKDWDEKLVEIAAERFRHQYREDPRDHPVGLQELFVAAESAKRTLTERNKAALHVNHLGTRLKVEVSREEFIQATAPLLERTRMTTELVVRQAGLTFADLDRILLVGGSTRMPQVVRMLEELTGKSPDRSISVDEAVAHGAALYAQQLASQPGQAPAADFSVTNVNSHSLGILGRDPASGEQLNKIIIRKNSALPCTVTKRFMTYRPNQRQVLIKVLEGESLRPEVCSLVGTCTISDLPTNLPKGWPVDVSYTYASNGSLDVTAKLRGHKAGITTQFVRENSLADEEVEMWTHCIEEELTRQS